MPDASAQREHPERRPVDILIVDDTPSKLLALESSLAPLGENLVQVRSGREALRQLLNRDFATIILDVNMPGLDGFETARMIRSRLRSAGTPIIFISAVSMDEADSYQGYSLGAVDYICAPIVPEILRAKVAVFVELHRKSEEARLHAKRLEERSRELEMSQRDLRLSERMASLGTLCAGLGHDMGNLLLPVSVWAESLSPDKLPPELCEGVENLRTCVQYLRGLASGLRLLSLDPSQRAAHERTDLARWHSEIGPVLRNSLPRGVSIDISIPPDLPAVRIESHRLAQVAFNLVQNAGEVLRDRPGGRVQLWARREAQGVRIGIADNGPGMSKEILERCLDPFFTTKTRGITTGLGLSLVHSIVRSAGSGLEIDSGLGRGATFTFALQVIDAVSSNDTPALISIRDPRQRAIALSLARSAGYRVLDTPASIPAGPAVLITDSASDIDELANAFAGGDSERHVLLLSEQRVDCESARVVALTGQNGLGAALRHLANQSHSIASSPTADPSAGSKVCSS